MRVANEVIIHINAKNNSKSVFDDVKRQADDAARAIRQVTGDQDVTVKVHFDKDSGDGTKQDALNLFESINNSAQAFATRMAGQAAAIIAAVLAGLLVTASAVADSLVLGLGGGLVALGALAVAQSQKIKSALGDAADWVVSRFAQIAAPLEESFLNAIAVVQRTLDKLSPYLASFFEKAAPAVDRFINAIGEGFASLGPALQPLGDAFVVVLDAISARAPEVFSAISDAIITLAGIAEAHADDIGTLFVVAAGAIKVTAEALSFMSEEWDRFVAGFEAMSKAISEGRWADIWSDVNKADADAVKKHEDAIKAATEAAKAHGSQIGQLSSGMSSGTDNTAKYTAAYAAHEREIQNTIKAYERYQESLERDEQATIRLGGQKLALVQAEETYNKALTAATSTQVDTVKVAEAWREALKGTSDELIGTENAQQSLDDAIAKATDTTNLIVKSTISYQDALEGLSDQFMGVDGAINQWEKSLDDAQSNLNEYGRTLDAGTQQGRENRQSLIDIAEAAQKVIETMHDTGASTDELTSKMQTQREQFIQVAEQFGLTRGAAEELADRYGLTTDAVIRARDETATHTEKLKEDDQALRDIAERSLEVILKMKDLGASTSDLNSKAQENRERFIEVAEKMGISKDRAAELADQYGLTKNAINDANAAARDQSRDVRSASEKLQDLAGSAFTVLERMMALGSPMEDVRRKAGEQRDEFIRVAEKMGYTKDEAKKLADQYGLMPADVKTVVSADTQEAINALDRLRNSIAVSIQEWVDQARRTEEQRNKRTGGVVGAAATGGIRGSRTLVGEAGPEIVDLPYGSIVHPAGTTRAMLEGGGGGVNINNLNLHFADDRNMSEKAAELVEYLRFYVRRGGVLPT